MSLQEAMSIVLWKLRRLVGSRNDKRENHLKHLPFALLLFLVLFLGATDLAIGVDARVLATLLAPIFWLGFYWLGSDRAARGGN